MAEINIAPILNLTLDQFGVAARRAWAEHAGTNKPPHLSAAVSGTTVTLTISDESNAGTYAIYQGGLKIDTITGALKQVTGLAENTAYSFVVVPVVNGTELPEATSNTESLNTGVQAETPTVGNVFALNGDSRMQYAANTNRTYSSDSLTDYANNANQIISRAFFATLQAEMQNRIILARGGQFAIAAETTDIIAARASQDAAQAAALGVTTVIFCAGVNDNGVLTSAQSIANYQTIFTEFTNQGITTLLLNELPADGWESDATAHLEKVAWLSDPARESEYDLHIIDTFNGMKEPGTNCTYKTGYTYDGTHMTYTGYMALKDIILTAIDAMIPLAAYPSLNRLPTTGTESDYINQNPLLTGTTGTITGDSVISGDIADGCRVVELQPTNNVGLTVTPSKSTNPDGYDEQVIEITGSTESTSSLGQGAIFYADEPANAASEVLPGEKVRLFARIRIDAGAANVYAIKLNNLLRGTDIDSNTSGTYVDQAGTMSDARAFGPDEYLAYNDGEAVDLVLMTPELVIPDNWNAAGASGQRFISSVDIKVKGENEVVAVTARISQMGLIVVDQ